MKHIEFYVVNWAEYDKDIESLDGGVFADLYSTMEKAREVVMDMILTKARDDMNLYDKTDLLDIFGTEDARELAKKMVVRDTGDFIVVRSLETAVETKYGITKYSTEFVK